MAGEINVGDDTIENEDLRSSLLPVLQTLPDGSSIREVFERAISGDGTTVPALLALLKHPDTTVEWWAARYLGRFGGPAVSEALRTLAADSKSQGLVRAGALRGLLRMRDPSTPELARSGLEDPGYWVQLASLTVLEAWGDSANSPAVVAFLDSRTSRLEPSTVFHTLEVLGDASGSTIVVDRLALFVNDKSKLTNVRSDAARALKTLGRPDLGGRVLERDEVASAFRLVSNARFTVAKVTKDGGIPVSDPSQLETLLLSIEIDGEKPVDPWGQPLRGRFHSKDVFDVVSAGPDKMLSSPDDVSTAESFADYDGRIYVDLFGPPIPPAP